MKNKYLLSLLAALGFSGCGNNNEIWDEPCYYGPGPVWTPDIIISSQVQNEEKETINGIRVVSSYMNQEDSLITDTAYTESREIEHYTVSGIAINTFKFKEYPPKDTEMYLEYTDVDGEKNGAYQTKKIRIQDLGKEGKVTLLKEEKKEEEKEVVIQNCAKTPFRLKKAFLPFRILYPTSRRQQGRLKQLTKRWKIFRLPHTADSATFGERLP